MGSEYPFVGDLQTFFVLFLLLMNAVEYDRYSSYCAFSIFLSSVMVGVQNCWFSEKEVRLNKVKDMVYLYISSKLSMMEIFLLLIIIFFLQNFDRPGTRHKGRI